MIDTSSLAQWWHDWQLRVLVLGSLGLQWFLLLAAPMRKYSVPHALRTCIWLAYISSDALAIYALATLFNRHARTLPASYCPAPPPAGPGKQEQSHILEVLWAPILLIHLGGQEELTAYNIDDNQQWTRHTVTLVSQVAVALYAFYRSWQPISNDRRLTAATALLFVIGVLSFSEKPIALRAKMKRLATASAKATATARPSVWRERLRQFRNCFTVLPRLSTDWDLEACRSRSRPAREVVLSPEDKVLMVLSDMSLGAAAKDLVERRSAVTVDELLPPLLLVGDSETGVARWLRDVFAFIYTRSSVAITPMYLIFHLALVPVLHVAVLTLFATSDKDGYKRADVKITYIILCLTAALDLVAVFVRQLVYRLMSMTQVPALCETMPGYNLIDEAVGEADKGITGWIYMCARQLGFTRSRHSQVYRKVSAIVFPDLVEARGRDLATYRVFDDDETTTMIMKRKNWALSKELQRECGEEIRRSMRISFDRSVLLWHIATDLCFRCIDFGSHGTQEDDEEEIAGAVGEGQNEEDEQDEDLELGGSPSVGSSPQVEVFRLYIECTQAISNYMAHLLNSNSEMLLTGSRQHLISEARDEVKSVILSNKVIKQELDGSDGCSFRCSCTGTGGSCSCSKWNRATANPFGLKDQLRELIIEIAGRKVNPNTTRPVFHIIAACKLAIQLLEIKDDAKRMEVMYRLWLGMLCYSASMSRGYLHAKSLGEGGEFLSVVWLALSLKGAKTLADKLQLPPDSEDTDNEPRGTNIFADNQFGQSF